ncbi:hypothetical protein B0H10DRAFT_1989479 [Mycena sp. CBHHK59/15]|nr:hypothetical protein B0H10DRAFT_1989479 [Mycena sp. CBHHK59/15]
MGVTTGSAALHIAPVVIKTFLRHGKRLAIKQKEQRPEEAQDDIFFDEAFHIVKAFIEFGTKNTVESLQAFTNTHVPAPPWASVAPVCIPLHSCNDAADILIKWFGPDELKAVVGGEKWWQVRGLEGIDGEWITEKDYLSDDKIDGLPGRKLSDDDRNVLKMEKLDRVMVSSHGGYFWGSITRKIQGRAFAVNYRKAPQYPWPCPLQDVLAAYLYLIRPPPNALHKAIPSTKIVLAGDSAGGGLCLSVLSILRDMGLPMPAGSVLISPWDIIPQHGFLAKPSTLWPVEPIPQKDERVVPAEPNSSPQPGHADQLRPTKARQREMQTTSQAFESSSRSIGSQDDRKVGEEEYDIDQWEPRPPKVRMNDPNAVPLELRSQIQLYATTEQLSHPLVSPVLQGSLGNLPPLYVLAGNDEVLRDEILYIAHRAAYPDRYPTRKGVLRDAPRQKENADKFTRPTKVHLQVFDDMCHVLTVFTFTDSHVTDHDEEHLSRKPFPELHRPVKPSDKQSLSSLLPTMQSKPVTQGGSSGTFVQEESSDLKLSELEPPSVSVGENSHKHDILEMRMIRERVNIEGVARPMEPLEDMSILNLEVAEIGIIKEAPTIKWLKGQEEWDRKYRKNAERAIRQRQKNEEKAKRLIANAREQGLLLVKNSAMTTGGTIQVERRWGPLDLDEERPPPTAIAKRRDTPEALALLKKHIYHTAPATHRTIPKLKLADAVRAAFDPNDDPSKAPRQSVSEAQVRTRFIPEMHGLRIWDMLVGYFMRKSSEKATNGKNAIKSAFTPD